MFRKKAVLPLKEPDSFEHGYNYAIFLLGLRLRTEGEILYKMKERGYAQVVVDAVMDALRKNAYVNDARFAELFIENCKRFKLYGYYVLKKKLLEKRMPKELIELSLKEYFTAPEELAVARRYLNKERLLTDNTELTYEIRQKVLYKLSQKGFRSEVLATVLGGHTPVE